MAKIYIRFELIGSGNLDYRNIVSARLVKDRYTPYSELRASFLRSRLEQPKRKPCLAERSCR